MFSVWSDRLTFISICLLVFVLPVSVAGVSIFAAGAIFFFIAKKISALALAWRHPNGSSRWGLIGTSLALPRPAVTSTPVGFFVLVCFLSIFMSIDPSLSFKAFIGKTLKITLLFFAVQECMTTSLRIRWFLMSCMVSALVLCLDGLWQMYFGFDVFKHNFIKDGRINASFGHANDLGAYLIIMIPLFVVSAFSWVAGNGQRLGVRFLKFVGAAIMTALFMMIMGLTFSRAAWLGLACAGIVFMLFDKRTWMPCVLIAVVFFGLFLPLLKDSRQVSLFTDSVAGVTSLGGSGRIIFWNDALDMIARQPLFGTGLNTYMKVIREHIDANQFYAHNCYLQLTAELGLVGLTVFLWVLVSVFILVRRKILSNRSSGDRLVLIALLAGWTGILIESALDTTFYSTQLSVLLWVIMGLLVAFPLRLGSREGVGSGQRDERI